ncbi:MAG: hypothetical protein K2N74_01995, partial [Clostridiales bacterium]|nr:hypothetical protein [Clostridiales bacterium]
MDNETENSLTIGEVCGIIWKRILYVLAASALVMLAAVLVFIFAINPSKVSYSGEFWVVYPAMYPDSTKKTPKYPDGSDFYYHDIISKESLQAIVDSDEQLKKIDVEKLLASDGLSFTAERDEDNLITGQYFITIKGKNMPGYEDAKRFVAAISQK